MRFCSPRGIFLQFAGGVIVQVPSVLDGRDWVVSRWSFKGLPFKVWLDQVLDRYTKVALAVGVTHGFALGHLGITPWNRFAVPGFMLARYVEFSSYRDN